MILLRKRKYRDIELASKVYATKLFTLSDRTWTSTQAGKTSITTGQKRSDAVIRQPGTTTGDSCEAILKALIEVTLRRIETWEMAAVFMFKLFGGR